jgi:hypothetical protein
MLRFQPIFSDLPLFRPPTAFARSDAHRFSGDGATSVHARIDACRPRFPARHQGMRLGRLDNTLFEFS